MADSISTKVETYEKFLNEKLRTDLKKVYNEREKVFAEVAEYLQIKNTIEKIVENKKSEQQQEQELKTKIDLGCNFYVNAVISDYSRIYIAIGYGFYLEMTLDEALKFIDKKVKLLNKTIEELTEQSSLIKANIRLVLEGLREVQNLEFQTEDKNIIF